MNVIKNRSLLRLLFTFLLISSYTQTLFSQATINYGNNPAAGKYYTVRGIKIYCEIYGNGSPLLLLHGNGGNISAFAHNIPELSEKYKVIAADSRAQGKSADDKDSLSFEMMADDEAALLDAMNIKSAYVIGWSDGGIVALLMAMRHPDKVTRLASSGANLWPDSTAITPVNWKHDKAYYDSSHTKVFTTARQKNDWKIFMLDWLQPDIPANALQAIHCPSLIISGDHDVITLEHTVIIYKNIPHAQLWVVPNSGHATLIEHYEEFNKKVEEFFQQK